MTFTKLKNFSKLNSTNNGRGKIANFLFSM